MCRHPLRRLHDGDLPSSEPKVVRIRLRGGDVAELVLQHVHVERPRPRSNGWPRWPGHVRMERRKAVCDVHLGAPRWTAWVWDQHQANRRVGRPDSGGVE